MTAVLSSSPSLSSLGSSMSDVSFTPRTRDYFAFARIKGDVCLVQGNLRALRRFECCQVLTAALCCAASCATPASALTTVDVKIFKHEFISIFRFSEYRTLHPADISILEPIDDQLTRYEEDNETVFLARDVMERMRKLTDPRWGVQGYGRRTAVVRQHQRQR
ncbi:hypothetical protein BDN70DRAFT_870384 [Pholiota conissans]|uniref:Uncharacterized protein n=1 Tax=Pholiota conissans TaxID=109636 RepID=A0A9P5ZI48_9AGAR|nr:hypothetical protein BDN70DRAFT_870384 [Pholiota conissans]